MKRKPTKDRRVVFLMDPDEYDELVRRAAQHESIGAFIRAAIKAYQQ